MLIKVGNLIFNTGNIACIDLFNDEDDQGQACVLITLFSGKYYFWDEEAEILRWYFNHPISDVVDVKDLKG